MPTKCKPFCVIVIYFLLWTYLYIVTNMIVLTFVRIIFTCIVSFLHLVVLMLTNQVSDSDTAIFSSTHLIGQNTHVILFCCIFFRIIILLLRPTHRNESPVFVCSQYIFIAIIPKLFMILTYYGRNQGKLYIKWHWFILYDPDLCYWCFLSMTCWI